MNSQLAEYRRRSTLRFQQLEEQEEAKERELQEQMSRQRELDDLKAIEEEQQIKKKSKELATRLLEKRRLMAKTNNGSSKQHSDEFHQDMSEPLISNQDREEVEDDQQRRLVEQDRGYKHCTAAENTNSELRTEQQQRPFDKDLELAKQLHEQLNGGGTSAAAIAPAPALPQQQTTAFAHNQNQQQIKPSQMVPYDAIGSNNAMNAADPEMALSPRSAVRQADA